MDERVSADPISRLLNEGVRRIRIELEEFLPDTPESRRGAKKVRKGHHAPREGERQVQDG